MRFRLLVSVVLAVASLTSLPRCFAQTGNEFNQANQAYAAGKFKDAIDGYEKLVRTGEWSANLFYDLGNAYYRANDFGRAILNYERALALEPNHPEAQANLRIARDNARALELPQSWVERLARFAHVRQYTILAALALWLGVFGIVWLIFARRRSRVTLAFSLLALGAGAFLVYAVIEMERGNNGASLAIVTSQNVIARVATADSAGTVLALPPGSEVRILSQRGDWTYAVLPNDLRGWIPAASVRAVRF